MTTIFLTQASTDAGPRHVARYSARLAPVFLARGLPVPTRDTTTATAPGPVVDREFEEEALLGLQSLEESR